MIGTTIHGYTISKHLGTGGMAEVWYAENKLGKPASIKIMLKQFIGIDQVVLRFENEAKTMVQLQHPNIRQVYDYGEFEQQPFIIMEYLEGQDLSSFIKVKKAPSDEQFELWWQQCSSALNFTHSQGVIHRDIKPSNLFLDKNGDIKILDFGIAKVKQEITLTATGQGLGTLLYMSPQQILDPKRVTPQCDYHSLAVSFIHLITGQNPYAQTESEFQLQSAIVNGDINLDGLPAKWKERLEGLVQGKNEKELNKVEGLAISQSHSPTQVYNDGTHIEEKPTSKAIENNVEQPKKKKSILLFALIGVVMLSAILVFVLKSVEEPIPQWKIEFEEQFNRLLVSESSRDAQQNLDVFTALLGKLPNDSTALDERNKLQEMIDKYQNVIVEAEKIAEAERDKLEIEERIPQVVRINAEAERDKLEIEDRIPQVVRINAEDNNVIQPSPSRQEPEKTGTFVDTRDGKTYKWVKIGNQVWMAQNLAYKPQKGNYWAFDNKTENVAKYGYLYDWETACKVCPSGWHLPSDSEWSVLINYLGGVNLASYKMKSTWAWKDGRNGNNVSGFNGLPGGYRDVNGTFGIVGNFGFWWSSTEFDAVNAWYRPLYYNNGYVGRDASNKANGFSVRCLRD